MKRLILGLVAGFGSISFPVSLRLATLVGFLVVWAVAGPAVFAVAGSAPAEGAQSTVGPRPGRASRASLPRPRTSGAVPLDLRFFLWAGHRLALERLEEVPACGELFAALGADGRELLGRTVYTLPAGPRENGVCLRAVAFTAPGSVRTVVCPVRFRALPRGEAAAILLHEALHLAGLGEWPYDPEAPTSKEITELVRSRCRL